ncbi:CHAD domain-containing protein [Asticcacaulis solisilvae]|uniref:CHAD domain-containing protein n=1 Tax=Asticcacaulis solisilvae TaxID=1217274 RepID=UPI003FD8EFEC
MTNLHIAHRPLAESVRQLILREMDDMCYPPRPDHEVHDLRVSGKRIRAWLRILRDAMGEEAFARENAMVRDLGRLFSGRRDSHVLIRTLEALEKDGTAHFAPADTASLRAALQAEAASIETAMPMPDALSHVRDALFPARRRLEGLTLSHAHPRTAFRRIWKKASAAHAEALKTRDTEALHEWRKQAKSLRYQLEALKDIWPKRVSRWNRQLKMQGDLLGQDHDLSVLADKVTDEQRAVIASKRKDMQDQAFAAAAAFYRARPKKLARALTARWKRWRKAD